MAGLLDTLISGYATGAGLLAPNEQDVKMRPKLAKALLEFLPGSGDAISGYDAAQSARQGNYGEAALNGLGVLPFIPAMGGMIKSSMGRIPETADDANKLAKLLIDAANKKGYSVVSDASRISPSRYVTLANESGDIERQVRLSNHADKYPELANGVRTSVDPSTEVTFEQAVNWLAREGFPTSLSKKYEKIPSWDQVYASRRAADALPENKLQKLIDAWRNQPKSSRGPMPTLDDIK